MAYEIEWADSAIEALVEQLDYIAKDSPSYASSLSTKAEAAAASLDQFPRRGRVVPEYGNEDIREIPVGSYRLIYQIFPTKIAIITFIHSARDLAALLRRGED